MRIGNGNWEWIVEEHEHDERCEAKTKQFVIVSVVVVGVCACLCDRPCSFVVVEGDGGRLAAGRRSYGAREGRREAHGGVVILHFLAVYPQIFT